MAWGEEAVEIAEAADHPYSRVLAEWGLGTLHLLKGEPERAIFVLERGLVVARMMGPTLLFPFVAGPLGLAYALCGRRAEGRPLLEQALEQAASLNLVANQSLRLTWLGEAHLLASGLERGGASSRPRRPRSPSSTRNEATRRMPGGSSARSRRSGSPRNRSRR